MNLACRHTLGRVIDNLGKVFIFSLLIIFFGIVIFLRNGSNFDVETQSPHLTLRVALPLCEYRGHGALVIKSHCSSSLDLGIALYMHFIFVLASNDLPFDLL